MSDQLQDNQIKPKRTKRKKIKQPLSIEDFDVEEQILVVNTPKSKQSCKLAGCHPKELLFKPIEAFVEISSDPNIQQMHFKFYNEKRLNLISQVKSIRQSLVGNQRPLTERSITFKLGQKEKSFKHFDTPKSQRAEFQSIDVISKAREKQQKLLYKMLQQEQQTAQKIKEYYQQQEDDKRRQEELNRQKIEEDQMRMNKKFEYLVELRNKRSQEQFEARKKDIENLKKDQEDAKRAQEKLQEKINRLQEKQKLAEQRRVDHQSKIQQNLQEQEKLLMRKILEREKVEKVRKKQIQESKIEQIQKMQERQMENEVKRSQALEQMKTIEYERLSDLNRRRELAQHKFLRFKMSQDKLKEKLKERSLERNQKTQMASQKVIEVTNYKKMALENKKVEIENRLEQNRMQKEQEILYKKEEAGLKEYWKQVNIWRQQQREMYIKKQITRNIKKQVKKAESFHEKRNKTKQDMLRLNEMTSMQKKEIKEIINRMAITNQWDMSVL